MRSLVVAALLGGAFLVTVDRVQAAMLTFSGQPSATSYIDVAEQQMTISDYGVPADVSASEESTVSGASVVRYFETDSGRIGGRIWRIC